MRHRSPLSPVLTAAVAMAGSLLAPPARADLLGVDVSSYQGFVNWNAMKNDGVSFAFARGTRGAGVEDIDPYFSTNMINARNAGVTIGPYHYAYPNTAMNPLSAPVKQDAINEANDYVDLIKPFYDQYPGVYLRPALDIEELPSNAEVNTIAEQRQYLSDWIRDFNSVVQDRLGLDVIIYTNGNYANTYLEPDLAAFDLWFAKPTNSTSVNPPTSSNMGIWNDYVFWQYSWEGNLGGENPLDLDTFRGTMDDLQQYVVGPAELVGDFNDDGRVDAADYTIWRDTKLAFGDWPADANGNGVVEQGDYDLWAANYGASSAAVAVPEPASLALLVLGAVVATRRRLSFVA